MPMKHALTAALVITATLLAASPNARAEEARVEAEAPSITPTIGARIGGYGFRQVSDRGLINWMQCRMNGVGVYGTVELPRHAYTELSLDMYHATAQPISEGLDRLSIHALGSVGWRMLPDRVITPNVHAGGGAEWTWISVFGHEDQTWAPVGFVGLGGELNIERFHLGVAIRSHVMRLPEYDWQTTQPQPGDSAEPLDYRTELAAQMLFSVRYDI